VTEDAKIQLAKDVLYEVSTATQAYETVKARLAQIGERFERLGYALQNYPEQVRPLPEVGSNHNYRDALNEIGSARQQIIDLCEELRTLQHRKNAAEQRRIALRL
jgi:hypothetical protein